MSERSGPGAGDQAPAVDSIAVNPCGALLRQAREAGGLHIEALAALLKVPVKKLEALEADRFDLLPDTVFVRALAASVCRTLKIDPVPILDRLPHTTVPSLMGDVSGINTPFRAAGEGAGFAFLSQLSKPVFLAVLFLLLGAVVIVVYPFNELFEVASAPASGATEVISPLVQSTPAPEPSHGTVPGAGVMPSPSSTVSFSSADAPTLTNPAALVPSAVLPAAAGSILPAGGAGAGAGAMPGLIVFKTRATSWVEVVDAAGVVQLRKTMADGDVAAASGVLPLSVVVGRADTTAVEVRGKPINLTVTAKNNVARFEVK